MKLSEVARILNGKLIGENNSVDILYLSTDSRKLFTPKQTLFFALKTAKNDGHHYVSNVFDAGIAACIVSQRLEMSAGPYILVSDTLIALQQLSKWKRNQFSIPVLALTGSNGKTIIKEWLATVLENNYRIVKSPKSYNSQIGIPLSVWGMASYHSLAIFETGISKKGEMDTLEQILKPDYVLFTNLGTAHDEGFTSREEKALEKLALAKNAKNIILRFENETARRIAEKLFPEKVITWSFYNPDANFHFSQSPSSILYKNETIAELTSTGEWYLENVGHVLAVCLVLQLDTTVIKEGIRKLHNIPMRLEIKEGINQCILVDDTYTNDTAGLQIAIQYLSQLKQREKKTLICSDLSDTDSLSTHRQMLESALSSGIQRILAIGPIFEQLQPEFDNIQVIPSVESLLSSFPDFEKELILIKGARKYKTERIVSALQAKSHKTYLEVNFEALLHNVNTYKTLVSPGVKTMAMMKAMAYGSGNLEIASILQFHGVDYLGVAFTDEAVTLRQNGIRLPILVMSPEIASSNLLIKYDLEPEIYSLQFLEHLNQEVFESSLHIHLKIETGMNRLGILPEQLKEAISILLKNDKIKVKGIFTHFAAADDPAHDRYTVQQADLFIQCCLEIEKALGYKPLRHAVNSSGIVRWPQYHWDMVRLGIGLHGFDPTGTLPLRHVSTLRSYVTQVKEVPADQSIGYGRRGKITQSKKIAIVPIGYADGYRRTFGEGKGNMRIKGILCPTIGSICMDMTMLDISDTSIVTGDEVTVFGEEPTIQQLAEWANTIPYEILTNISSRVKRIYTSE